MSEEQLSALLAKLKDDAGLQEKLKGAADLDAAVGLAKEAGFDVSKADWLKYQQGMVEGELSDEELEGAAGGGIELCMSAIGDSYPSPKFPNYPTPWASTVKAPSAYDIHKAL